MLSTNPVRHRSQGKPVCRRMCSSTPKMVTPRRREGSAGSGKANALMYSPIACQSTPNCRAIAETAMSCSFSC